MDYHDTSHLLPMTLIGPEIDLDDLAVFYVGMTQLRPKQQRLRWGYALTMN